MSEDVWAIAVEELEVLFSRAVGAGSGGAPCARYGVGKG